MASGDECFHRLWRCHPHTALRRIILTPWKTSLSVGFVGIEGGGENYLTFHQPHSDKFMPYANHQQIWPICIIYGADTPNFIVGASSQHHG